MRSMPRRGTSMPDIIRKRCGFQTHPWYGRFHLGCAALGATALAPGVALAQERPAIRPVTDYLDAFTALNGHEIAVLALSLGVILFAVTTAISLLRTRTRAALTLAAKQSEINELREERARANALLMHEPQIIVVWPAGTDEPDITGDVSIVTRATVP